MGGSLTMDIAIGASFQNVHNGWRWIVGLGAMPSFVQLAAIGFLPESRMFPLRAPFNMG